MSKNFCHFLFLWLVFMAANRAVKAQDSTPSAVKFLWGVANSAFQVEGFPENSDWKTFTHTPGKIQDGTNADVAARFWTDYEKDFALAKELGSNAFRISIAWERVEPKAGEYNEAALAQYEKMIVSMRAQGLEPVVTLHHFVLPDWLVKDGGLLAKNFPQAFANFAKKVVERLALPPSNVQWWMTFNEPNVLIRGGYMQGDWPPGEKRFDLAVQAMAQLVRAHVAAVNEIRSVAPHVQISIAQHWRVFEVKRKWNPLDYLAKWASDWFWNQQTTQAMFTGKLNLWLPGGERVQETLKFKDQGKGLDYLGVNYYGRTIASLSIQAPFVKVEDGPGAKSDLGWEIYPQGLYEAIRQSYELYRLPIMIAENGLADAADSRRANFLSTHLDSLQKARDSRLPVIGYLHWSLTDNFEWAYGQTPRFGLVELNYQTGERKKRPSFSTYQQWISAHP